MRISASLSTFAQRLGFDSFTEEIEDVLKDHKKAQKVRIYFSPFLSNTQELRSRTGRGKFQSWKHPV